jgi:hypothetical protein
MQIELGEENLQAANISVTKLNGRTTYMPCWTRNHIQCVLYSEFRKQRFFHAEFLRLTVAKHAIRSEVNKTNRWKFHRITAGDGQK